MQACHEASISLMERAEDEAYYEVVVGTAEDSHTEIRDNRQRKTMARVHTPEILNCTMMRSFWISWADGYIELGTGDHYGVDRVIHWQDMHPLQVNMAAISTSASATGHWMLTTYESNYYLCICYKSFCKKLIKCNYAGFIPHMLIILWVIIIIIQV